MTTTSSPPIASATWSHSGLKMFTVDEYHQMIAAGIITEEDDVELLEGSVVLKMGRNPPHDLAIETTDEALRSLLPPGWRLRIQSAITTDDSEPEPDLAVVRGAPRARGPGHPRPPDLALVIEVSDATLARDRLDKARVYARASVACYWIVNLVDRQLEVFTQPSGPDPQPAYRQVQTYSPQDKVPLVVDGQVVATLDAKDLFP